MEAEMDNGTWPPWCYECPWYNELVATTAREAVENMRLVSTERQRDQARRVARALYELLLAWEDDYKSADDMDALAAYAKRVIREESKRAP